MTALDTSAAMLQRCTQHATGAGVALHTLHADMRSFSLDDRTVDMAFCLLGTFCHMLSCQDALATLRCTHRCVEGLHQLSISCSWVLVMLHAP